jgi:hypothetical protein
MQDVELLHLCVIQHHPCEHVDAAELVAIDVA